MATNCYPGDRVVCKVKEDTIVSVYEEFGCTKKIFDIIANYNLGYLIFIPTSSFIKDSVFIKKDNYKSYNVDKRFIDSYACFITD